MSDNTDANIYTGRTPSGTLYYLAHVSTIHEAPPTGVWRGLKDVSASAASFGREFVDTRPERSLDHLLPQHFVEIDSAPLQAFAQSKGVPLKVEDNPFGTLRWFEYALPAASWPTLPQDMHVGSWTIQSDWIHILATLPLPSELSPDHLNRLPFPLQMTKALQAEFSDWNLEDERLAVGWNWHDLPGSRPLYGGLMYQLPDTSLVMTGGSTLSSSIQTYVGSEASKYLPMILANVLTLRFTTRVLTARLNETGSLSVNPDGLQLPLNLDDASQRALHQTALLNAWRDISGMQRTLDNIDDLVMASRTWITALEALRQHGFQRKPTGPGLQRIILYGPSSASMRKGPDVGIVLTPTSEISLTGRDLPTVGLERTRRNAEHFRTRLGQQATTVKEGVNIQSSLMSARSAEQSTDATIRGLTVADRTLKVSQRTAWIALLTLVLTGLTLVLTVDWGKFSRRDVQQAAPVQTVASKGFAFGITYPQSKEVSKALEPHYSK